MQPYLLLTESCVLTEHLLAVGGHLGYWYYLRIFVSEFVALAVASTVSILVPVSVCGGPVWQPGNRYTKRLSPLTIPTQLLHKSCKWNMSKTLKPQSGLM